MRMITPVLSATLAAAVVAVAGLASHANAAPSAAKACAAQRAAIGEQAFKLLYGTNASRSNAFGKCVTAQVRARQAIELNAAQTCRAERDSMGAAAFADKYGKNKNDQNAFGKCVSQHASAAVAALQQATINAAKACKAERQTMGAEAFRNKYGTNRTKSNAFGKCVSSRVPG
jgi:hypothetical protein